MSSTEIELGNESSTIDDVTSTMSTEHHATNSSPTKSLIAFPYTEERQTHNVLVMMLPMLFFAATFAFIAVVMTLMVGSYSLLKGRRRASRGSVSLAAPIPSERSTNTQGPVMISKKESYKAKSNFTWPQQAQN